MQRNKTNIIKLSKITVNIEGIKRVEKEVIV